uniref:Secreted protein n=1 Tax=Panagrellus redivivus TaxID=6233 RepID=A0A7E4VPP0_PANRE
MAGFVVVKFVGGRVTPITSVFFSNSRRTDFTRDVDSSLVVTVVASVVFPHSFLWVRRTLFVGYGDAAYQPNTASRMPSLFVRFVENIVIIGGDKGLRSYNTGAGGVASKA